MFTSTGGINNGEGHEFFENYGSLAQDGDEDEQELLLNSTKAHHHIAHQESDDSVTKASTSSEDSPRLRQIALALSLWINVFVTLTKLAAYIQTMSLSVLAALVDSVLDIVSQLILNYTEKHSSLSRSSAHYPAGASRLEPVGVLSCAALMGMASFEVIKESIETLASGSMDFSDQTLTSFWSLVGIIILKLALLLLCQRAAELKTAKQSVQLTDPTLEALAQDHWNDALSNGVAAIALLLALRNKHLWWVDPCGAILISIYIIHSWFSTGKEQVEQLTGKAAPTEFLQELVELADNFDERMMVDIVRAYHFGPKFLVEIEVVLPKDTLLFESHDLGMELQYEIESRPEVERCFVHIDYETRPYDEHVVSKVPALREKYRPGRKLTSAHSV
jgi:cation diffusion facilitator family transporter